MREETTCKPDYSNSMAEHLGIRFMPSATDEVRAEMPVDHRTSQPFGMLNGGASLALAEIARTRVYVFMSRRENMHAAYK